MKLLDKFYSDIIDYQNNITKCKLGCIMGNFSQELENTNENFREVLDVEFSEWEAIFLQCLNEAQLDRAFNENLDPKLVGNFLINSWHCANLRLKTTGNTKPLEDFKAFVFEQLLN